MKLIFYSYDCISINAFRIHTPHTGCKLISYLKGMVAMMLVLCLSNTQAIRIRGLNLSLTGVGVAFPLHHGGVLALKGSVPPPPPSVLFSSNARRTCSTKSTVTEFVERVMVVTRRLFFYILICCFTSNVGSRIHVETVSYLTTLFLGKSPVGSLLI